MGNGESEKKKVRKMLPMGDRLGRIGRVDEVRRGKY